MQEDLLEVAIRLADGHGDDEDDAGRFALDRLADKVVRARLGDAAGDRLPAISPETAFAFQRPMTLADLLALVDERWLTTLEPRRVDLPVVVLLFEGTEMLVDGRRRLNRWRRNGDQGPHAAIVIDMDGTERAQDGAHGAPQAPEADVAGLDVALDAGAPVRRRARLLQRFLKRNAGTPIEGPVLVAGSRVYEGKVDRRALYADAFGVDMLDGPGVDLVHDLETALPAEVGPFAHVDCVSVLEHVRRPWLFAANVERRMRPGASILICAPWVWRVHGYPDDYWRMTPSAIAALFSGIRWRRPIYLTDSAMVRRLRAYTSPDGQTWFPRSEILMWGERL